MSKIPPRDWPKYKSTSICPACESDKRQDEYYKSAEYGDHIMVHCTNCSLSRYERPLDFDFEKWRHIWGIEEEIEKYQAGLKKAREALDNG